ncbi:hypothetical protein HLB44_13980 [Aquincola sp. S2]|uniref:Calcineurin-like phosphoesterase domain-containing protein n=1 Tax=Pseudaquabacterium terrae TaxID=2732868 RepID=A0ABX2EHJ5_9BURK|nr:hypothetical protein [Aquabacterium terrae]NRF68097.1 hypothetical protein [Aquabacterium terrae]
MNFIAALAALVLAAAAAPAAAAFHFVALGDMPYGADAITGPAYRRLIEQINAERPPFSIHVGDFKDGVTACSDELFERQRGYFQLFDSALVFTPGDNDWSDCARTGSDPLERLTALRQRFFGQPASLGQRPIAVERQSDLMPEFERQRENLRWWHQGVLFATFHTIGPDNNAAHAMPALRGESTQRDAANIAWLRAAFTLAQQRRARALVLATQGDMLRYVDSRLPPGVRPGFHGSITRTLLPLAEASALPVLLVHGDSHRYITDQPFLNDRGQPIANLWRLQVFGDPKMHAVKVHVDPDAAPPFGFTPIWNPLSPDPRR